MVTPPTSSNNRTSTLTLVCCHTTQGSFSALLHSSWAPLGVSRLIDMIRNGYFDSRVPLFRCTNACQFGLSADPNVTKAYNQRIPDDPPWLPPGPDHRQNEKGVKRYPSGFWTYAGAGPNSRSNQFVITLRPNPYMGGGSPWEVPLGELVGDESFSTIQKWYTGYREKGPGQALLRREGYSEHVQSQWPKMDLILQCQVIDEIRN